MQNTTSKQSRARDARAHHLGTIPLLLSVLIAAGTLSLGIGAIRLPPLDVIAAFWGDPNAVNTRIVLELRLPRIVVAALCGAMFATSGAILQAVVRNPLASPDIIGVGAGAGLAAVLVLIVWPASPTWMLPVAAFAGAWFGFALVYGLSHSAGEVAPVRVALIGVAVAAALGGAQQVVLIRAPDEIGRALAFLAGTVYGSDWARVTRIWPWALALLPVAFALGRRLDVLSFNDDTSKGLGIRLELARLLTLSVGVGLAGAAVTGAGILGFVGLIAPHAARLLVGSGHARLLPASAILGATLVVLADALGRGLIPPIEVPAGIITTLVGAPYFLYLMRRSGRITT